MARIHRNVAIFTSCKTEEEEEESLENLENAAQKTLSGYAATLTMERLDTSASSLLTNASSCWMIAGGGSCRTGSRQDRVDSWTLCSG